MSLLRLLKGSGRVLGGSAVFEGRDLLALDEDALRELRGNRIGMIFQDPMTSLNPTLTVGEQVMEVILRHRQVVAQRGAGARRRIVRTGAHPLGCGAAAILSARILGRDAAARHDRDGACLRPASC